MSQVSFGEKVKEYLKLAGYSQKILASTLGLDRTVLSHKLNATGRTVLTHPEIKQIIRTLAELGAITTQAEALELLAEVNCPNFTPEEWQARPLKELEIATPSPSVTTKQPRITQDQKPAVKPAMPFPADTLTFLFTDIEGSTALWEKQPKAMPEALLQHDRLVRQAIENLRGQVFKTVGDAFYAVFSHAIDAVEAALALQKALQSARWGSTGPLKVRVALHAGSAQERDNDYFGPPINRVARLLSAGHGGQILLSLVVAELVRDHLPEGVSLRDLGEHNLKDLSRAERVFQLVAPGLPTDLPPLRNVEAIQPNLSTITNTGPSHNLPQQLSSFIGRHKEISELKGLLTQDKARLVTLIGAGGCGKTRLSLQVASELLNNFTDGVWLVELAPLSDPALIAQAMATALGLYEQAGRPLLTTVSDYLRSRRLLLVLDNCEHLVEECARIIDSLIRTSSNLHILATSREAFGIGGEITYRIPSLSLPDPHTQPELESLPNYEAVGLFMERAVAVNPAFALTHHNAGAVVQVCRQLDGIPLALELAAARIKLQQVGEVAARLSERFQLLTGGSRTALPRQKTLRALVDWSYALLTPNEQRVLAYLSVFAGGWTLKAAETVCGNSNGNDTGLAPYEILDALTGLVNKSLVQLEEGVDEARYYFHETIRQYGLEKLQANGEEEEVRRFHLAYYASLSGELGPKLQTNEQLEALKQMDQEFDNIRTAIEYGLRTQQVDAVFNMTFSLYWDFRGYYSEGVRYLEQLVALPATRGVNRGKAFFALGYFTLQQSDLEAARPYYEECLAISTQHDDKELLWLALCGMGGIYFDLGSRDQIVETLVEARRYLEQALELSEELGDAFKSASQRNLCLVIAEQGDYPRAQRLSEAVIIFEVVVYSGSIPAFY
jgi:predicted ATPase/class 3 adenylate cyclase